ncbi:12816_t:CDS:1, partial [Acaulospora colombiana]
MARARLFNKLIRSESVNSDDTLIAEIRSVTFNILAETILLGPPVKITLRDTVNGSGISG